MNELQQQQRESNEPIYLDCISVSSSVRAVDAANNGIDNDNEEKKEIKKLFVIEGEDVNVDDDDDDDKKNRGSQKSKSRGVPPRLVDTSRPSNWVGYFDAASLYPSSGEPNTIESLLGLARACILQERFSAGATMSAKKSKWQFLKKFLRSPIQHQWWVDGCVLARTHPRVKSYLPSY